MLYGLEKHARGYSISNWDIIFTAATGCSGVAYAMRHVDLACRHSIQSSWGHWVISAIEFLPLVGVVAALVERIISFIYNKFFLPIYPIQSHMFSIVSAYLPQSEALSLGNLFPGVFFGGRTELEVSANSIDAIEKEISYSKEYGTIQIQSLFICAARLSSQRIIDFIRVFRNLEHLAIKYCDDLSSLDVGVIAQLYPGLQSLDVSDCENLTDEALISIAKYCPGLQSLKVNFCHKLTNAGLISITESCPRLQSLGVSGCHITDAGLISITERCPGLQSLDVSGCYITDAGLISITERCQGLRSLGVSGCDNLTDAGLISITERRPGLQSLDVSGCDNLTDAGLISITERCQGLRSLNVAFCHKLTDAALLFIAQNCQGLQSLDITRCSTLTHLTLSHIAEYCLHLRNLRLTGYEFSPLAVGALLQQRPTLQIRGRDA